VSDTPVLAALLRAAESAALESGTLLLNRLRKVSVRYKGDVDLVTEADTASEALLIDRLQRALPEAGILAEEGGERAGSGVWRWVVDPLDGTTNYAHGYPVFSVSIALQHAGETVLGVVHDPTRGETFTAMRDTPARLNGRVLHASRVRDLGQALLVTGFPYDIRTSLRTNLPQFQAFALRARGVRRGGSAALDLAYVAAGRCDGFWEEKLAPWDLAAGALLVQRAGGAITGYGGGPLVLEAGHVVAAGENLHPALLEILADVERDSGLPPPASRFPGPADPGPG